MDFRGSAITGTSFMLRIKQSGGMARSKTPSPNSRENSFQLFVSALRMAFLISGFILGVRFLASPGSINDRNRQSQLGGKGPVQGPGLFHDQPGEGKDVGLQRYQQPNQGGQGQAVKKNVAEDLAFMPVPAG